MARIPLPVKCSTQNLTVNFYGAYSKIYACFEQKTAFAMQNFWNWGLVG